ncbi:conserved protein of unknown function [Mesotoga infera]|uniref:Outer membrane protein beta-barrel domain-containing protein n=1 Tax=Mesotoga infera TaxID=1236046 RepID=A0A7Z7LD89_9BACT|nr:hypothetical protein [Mesotoga infera]SSC11883.1 conserved protein of unknown function [Mesotoga infera]
MKKALLLLILVALAVSTFGYTFNTNNMGGSIAYFPFILQTFSARGYYHIGFKLTDPWSVGPLDFTQMMLYAGPTVSYSSDPGGASFELGISGRLFTGIENLSFPFFGRKFMVAVGLRGSSTYSFSKGKFSMPQISPALSIIDITKMTDRLNYSLYFWPLPVLMGFDVYF